MNTTQNDSWMDEKREAFNNILKCVFPNLRKEKSATILTRENELPTAFDPILSYDRLFKDSKYEYIGDKEFSHFTSLNALIAILKSGWFRVSNLSNLDDKNELNYGASFFNEMDEKSMWKENIYSLSACKSTIKNRRDKYMWEKYANNGNGVLIEYSLNLKTECDYLLGKILYGDEDCENTIGRLKSAYEEYTKNNKVKINNPLSTFCELFSFHKEKKFENENEIRLLFKFNEADIFQKFSMKPENYFYDDVFENRDIRKFLKIFLVIKNQENSNHDNHPTIKINKIILGYNLGAEEKYRIYNFLASEFKDKYDFDIFHFTPNFKCVKY
jgi:Protein of unknown function (DUF2971)